MLGLKVEHPGQIAASLLSRSSDGMHGTHEQACRRVHGQATSCDLVTEHSRRNQPEQTTIADQSNNLAMAVLESQTLAHTQGGRQRRRRMSGAKDVVGALGALEKAAQATFLLERVKAVSAALFQTGEC